MPSRLLNKFDNVVIVVGKTYFFELICGGLKVLRLLFVFCVLQTNQSFSQTWTAKVSMSDFDGLVKNMAVVGSGGESPFTSPILSIKKDNSGLSFLISGIGYTGCDFNNVYFVFDGVRKYKTMSVKSNEDKSGLKMREFASDPRTFHYDYFPIFNEMINSDRMSVRVENSCFKRDYSFTLDGFDNSFNILFSKDEFNLSVLRYNGCNDLFKRFTQTQEKYSRLSTFWRDNISKCDFHISLDGSNRVYHISDRVIKEVLTIFYVYDNDILKELDALWPDKVRYTIHNAELVKRTSTGDLHHTGYKVIFDGDSLKLDYSPVQKVQFNILSTYTGIYQEVLANFILLLTNSELPEYSHNFTPEVLVEIGRKVSKMKNDNNYQSFRVSMVTKKKAVVEYKKNLDIFWHPVPELIPFNYSIRQN